MFKNLIAHITPKKKESNIANKEKETELNKVLNERSKEIEHLQEEKTKLNETLNRASPEGKRHPATGCRLFHDGSRGKRARKPAS